MKHPVRRIIAAQATNCMEPEHDGYIQEVARLTQEVLDFDAILEDDIKKPQLDALRARLNKIKHWVSKYSSNMHTWNIEKLTRLRSKDSTTPPAELKTSLQRKILNLQALLHNKIMLQGIAQIGCDSYIHKVNNLTLEAGAKFQVLARNEKGIETTELNNFRTSLMTSNAGRSRLSMTCTHKPWRG